jgi:DNA end-binding protein Ku
LPKRKHNGGSQQAATEEAGAPVRSMWSGTITFGLVSIPVDLLSAVRPRQTAMKLVDKSGHALGREYHCSKEGKELDHDELVRGYETDEGKMVVITDEEFESVAPEMSGDIELRGFVPLEQIPPMYFQKPYFLAPSGKSAKAYNLLTATMQKTGRVGVGSFVMRGHEYLVAIVSDNGVLRADTLRYTDEIRTPESIGLPKVKKPAAAKVTSFGKAIDALKQTRLDMSELADQDAQALRELAERKQKKDEDVIQQRGLEEVDAEATQGSAQIIDLMEVLRKSLSKNAVVTRAGDRKPALKRARRA